jgi:hypothetical protein
MVTMEDRRPFLGKIVDAKIDKKSDKPMLEEELQEINELHKKSLG